MAAQITHNITDAELVELIGRDDPVVLELGSYDGKDGRRFLNLFPDCRVWAWEADPRNIALCEAGLADPRATVIGQAIHFYDGVTEWNGCTGTPPPQYTGPALPRADDWDQSSSIRRPKEHLTFSPWVKYPKSLQNLVPCMRLDTWLKQAQAFGDILVDFIWADLQGAEGDMVLGGVETLRRTQYLYTEAYDTEMYEKQLVFSELCAVLRVLDFKLTARYPSHNALFVNMRLNTWKS